MNLLGSQVLFTVFFFCLFCLPFFFFVCLCYCGSESVMSSCYLYVRSLSVWLFVTAITWDVLNRFEPKISWRKYYIMYMWWQPTRPIPNHNPILTLTLTLVNPRPRGNRPRGKTPLKERVQYRTECECLGLLGRICLLKGYILQWGPADWRHWYVRRRILHLIQDLRLGAHAINAVTGVMCSLRLVLETNRAAELGILSILLIWTSGSL